MSEIVKVGDLYEDCSHHPVLCVESDGDDLAGVSLLDGSFPRSCSIIHCSIHGPMSHENVKKRILHRDELLSLEKNFQETWDAVAYSKAIDELFA